MKLNDEQREAVRFPENICVAACPGSGKTRTILGKLLTCVEEVRDTARRIACITYTHAGVDEIEMRLRQFGSVGDDDYCEVGTIHSFCLTNILQPFHYLLGELHTGMRVIAPDTDEWRDLVLWLADKHEIDRRRIDRFTNVHRKPDHSIFSPPGIGEAAAEELVSYLDQNALVSFPDIIYHSCRLVEMASFISRGLASRFAWMLIDEFQDTSEGQVAIFGAIANHGKTKFFLVGDPNQSIMRFAGAHPTLMKSFPIQIGARSDLRLPGNYRCSQRIVVHAERLIPTNPPMRAVGEHKDYPVDPKHIHAEDPFIGIFGHYLPALNELGVLLGDAAVLAPTWFPLWQVARELRERGVPVMGPGARPYRRARLFSSLAEHLCAYSEDSSPDLFKPLQRALFVMLLNITGSPEWRVFSYDGRRCVCGLAAFARDIGKEHSGDALLWLRHAAASITARLLSDELLTTRYADSLVESAEDMIRDIQKNLGDAPKLGVTDLGLYARPRDCLQLMTMHGAKGREFDAVALIDVHDGRLPYFNNSTQDEYDEDRRQFYVAITRPRKLLMYITDSSDWRNRPSPFLLEVGPS
jgi:DNA helicase-2/ATP-dependent DNA helicase PcrA